MRSRLAAFVLLAGSLAAPSASGQDKADPKIAARALADHARALYDRGKYAEAIDSLEHAERLYHAPTLVFALARAHAALGKLVEARALFLRVQGEKLAPDAPPPFKQVKSDAPGEIEALDKRIPTVTILVRGGGGKSLRVSVDDAEMKDYRPDKPVLLNPGAHRITVVPFGGVGVTKSVDLKEGARASIEIELFGAAPAVVRDPLPPPPNEAPRRWLLPSLLCYGAGAVGLGVGIGTGIVTLNQAAALKEKCPSGTCPKGMYHDEIAAANGMGIASTAAFVLAGAGVLAGTLLLTIKPSSKGPAQTSVEVGPGSMIVKGVF